MSASSFNSIYIIYLNYLDFIVDVTPTKVKITEFNFIPSHLMTLRTRGSTAAYMP